jgi:hypothetical protein
MEGESPMPDVLNPLIQKDYTVVLMADGMDLEHERELEHFLRAMGANVLITDKNISFGQSFNLDSTEPAVINDHVIIHNENTYNGPEDYNKKMMNIYVTGDRYDRLPHVWTDLYVLVGPERQGETLLNETFFGRCLKTPDNLDGIPYIFSGCQPTDQLSWAMFLIDRKTGKLFWGYHTLAWAWTGSQSKIPKEYNKDTIFSFLDDK